MIGHPKLSRFVTRWPDYKQRFRRQQPSVALLCLLTGNDARPRGGAQRVTAGPIPAGIRPASYDRLSIGHERQRQAPACWSATLQPRWGAPGDDQVE
ncbi:hypothetical protein MBOT_03560 [Mycobacterium botniense]|uniref:Uncharacterized protein n=1 Tax=Mycobacterium botniense TaxID=84962 RepID=A0A7I9XSL6_9MYCO|nr:hypothetical protein MBOT_03560 [Mycobacterium botniense]